MKLNKVIHSTLMLLFVLSIQIAQVSSFSAPATKVVDSVLYQKQIDRLSKSLIKSYPKKKNIKEIVAEKVGKIEEKMNLYWKELTDDALKEGEEFFRKNNPAAATKSKMGDKSSITPEPSSKQSSSNSKDKIDIQM